MLCFSELDSRHRRESNITDLLLDPHSVVLGKDLLYGVGGKVCVAARGLYEYSYSFAESGLMLKPQHQPQPDTAAHVGSVWFHVHLQASVSISSFPHSF